jgi:hypothetical protein
MFYISLSFSLALSLHLSLSLSLTGEEGVRTLFTGQRGRESCMRAKAESAGVLNLYAFLIHSVSQSA